MCKPTSIDKRTSLSYLKIEEALLSDSPMDIDNNDHRDFSQRLMSNLTLESYSALAGDGIKRQRNQLSSKLSFETLVKMVMLGIILAFCIGAEIQGNKLKRDTLRLKNEMQDTILNIENRRSLRLKKLRQDGHVEGYFRALESYDVSLDSDLTGDIKVAYD
mmetsp:Transcript_6268/g.11850  ORF Transcript_6268/g.11850 Transcript_6268/m.11850 type:complete len:161 (+) Transcript_6268:174-656(+)